MSTSTDKAVEKFHEQASLTAFQLIWKTLGHIKEFAAEKKTIQRGMQRYAQGFLERYGQVKVLGMSEPVPLREIYAAARVVSPRFLHRFSTTEDLQESFLKQGRRSLFLGDIEEHSCPALDLANKSKFLNVLGAPGAGKSTFLRRLGLEALLLRDTWDNSLHTKLGLKAGLLNEEASRYKHDCLPVLIELRRFRTEEIDISQLIAKELANCGLPESKKLVESLLSDGRLLILLDGLDEAPGDKLDNVILHLRDFTDRHSSNRFVTSCRTAFYKDYFYRFTDVMLADFDNEQIASFVHNWFRSKQDRETETAEEFLRLLESSSAKELARTPLLLTFLCLTYDNGQQLPANRSDLYRDALDILLKKWAASKRIHNNPIYRELHPGLEVQMLASIAAPSFLQNRYFFTREELTGSIANFLRSELNAPKHLDSDQILEALEIQQGLIVQRARDAYSFSHLTLQEYLTAEWYVTNQRLDDLINKHLFDERWREVFLLVAGRVGRADDQLARMLNAAEESIIASSEVVQFLHWTDHVIVSTGNKQQDAARRAYALALALGIDFDLGIDFTRDFESGGIRAEGRARDLDLALDLARDLFLDLTRELGLSRDLDIAHDLDLGIAHDLDIVRALDPNLTHHLKFNIERTIAHAHEIARDLELDTARTRDIARDRIHVSFINYVKDNIQPLIKILATSQYFKGSWAETLRQLEAISESTNQKTSTAEIRAAWQKVQSTLVRTLALPQWPILTATKSRNVLRSYLEVCRLIVSCQSAATSVSRSAWENICRRLINPRR